MLVKLPDVADCVPQRVVPQQAAGTELRASPLNSQTQGAAWERPVVRFFGGQPRRCSDGFFFAHVAPPDCTAGHIDELVGPRSRVRRIVDVERQRSSTSMAPDANDPPWPEWRRVPR